MPRNFLKTKVTSSTKDEGSSTHQIYCQSNATLDAIPKFHNSQYNIRILSLHTKFTVGDVDKTPAT